MTSWAWGLGAAGPRRWTAHPERRVQRAPLLRGHKAARSQDASGATRELQAMTATAAPARKAGFQRFPDLWRGKPLKGPSACDFQAARPVCRHVGVTERGRCRQLLHRHVGPCLGLPAWASPPGPHVKGTVRQDPAQSSAGAGAAGALGKTGHGRGGEPLPRCPHGSSSNPGSRGKNYQVLSAGLCSSVGSTCQP